MWPPSAKLPRSAPAVLNGRCRARLDMSRSSLGVVLRGLPARGRSVTFPVWRKRCIGRTMMEWLTLKWSATLSPSGNASATTHKTSTVDITSSSCSIWLVTWSIGVDYSHMETGPLVWWKSFLVTPYRRSCKNAPAVLNGRCRARLDMSRSSLDVVLRGLPARGRSVAFPVWRKRCISRTMMEWLTLKWSATRIWLKPPICMPTACHADIIISSNFKIRCKHIYTVRQKLS
jgi:hypothetical protein